MRSSDDLDECLRTVDMAEKKELVGTEMTLLWFYRQTCCANSCQHISQSFNILLKGIKKHHKVVEVNKAGLPSESGEHNIHHPLESGECATEAKREHLELV